MSFIAGDIMIRMAADVASLRTDMDKAKSTVGDAVDVMKKAAGLLAGAFSAQMFVGWLKSAIDAGDEMNKLSQRTGIAVEEVAGLQLAFQLGGAESGVFASSMAKLSKQVVEGNQSLKTLGVETRNADGSVKNLKEVLYATADAFKGMEDGTVKSDKAIEIFGKSGAELIPILNSGSEGLREMDEMAAKLGLTMSAETASSAEKFNDTIDLIGMGLQGVARQVVAQVLPTLTSLAGTFLENMTKGDTLRKVAEGLATTLKLLYSAGVLVVEAFSTLGKHVGASAAMIVSVMNGDFAGAINIGKEYANDLKTSWGNTAKTLETVWSDSGGKTVESMVGVQQALKRLTPATKEQEEAAKKAAEAAKKHAEELDKMAESVRMENAGLSADFLRKLQQLTELRDTNRISVEEYNKALQSLIEKQPVVKEQMEAERKERELLAARQLEAIKNYEAQEQKMDAALKSAEDLIGGIERETSALTMSNTEREISNALLALEKAGLEKGTYAYEVYAEKIKAAVLDREAVRESIEKTKEIEAEWKKATDNITNGLTDALMRGFESGKGFAENLKDYIKNAFKTLIADFVIRPVMAPISGALTSLFSGNAMAGTGGAGGGLGSLLSSGMNLLNGGFMNGIGLNIVNSGLGQSLGLSSLQNIGGNMIAGPTGLGNLVGSGLGMLGNGFAGYGISKALSGGYSAGGGINAIAGIASMIPGIGPIAGVVGGLINRAFGMKAKEMKDAGITGTISGGDATGQRFQDWFQKGGWFRSNKSGTEFSALGDDLSAALDLGARGILDQTKAWADALKLPAETLSQVTFDFKTKLTGNAEEDKNAIELIFQGYQTKLTEQFQSVLGPFQKAGETIADTMQRLVSLSQASEQLNLLGGVFSKVATASIEARENIIGLAGGIEQLMAKAGQFVKDFYSVEEQAGLQAQAALELLRDLGLDGSTITSRDDFRKLVESVDVSTQQGQEQLVALLDIAPTFASLADYIKENNTTLEEVAAQAPVVAILDQMLPEAVNTAEAVGTVAERITEGNATLERIVEAIQTGNLSIATGLEALAQAQLTIANLQSQIVANTAATAAATSSTATGAALNNSAPIYSADVGSNSFTVAFATD